jgi:mRNA interferase MazF
VTRGDVYELSLRRGRGREQRGPRYGVIVQAAAVLDLSRVIVAPTSRSAIALSFRPEIELEGTKTRVMVEQMRAVDPQRLGKCVHHLTLDEQHEVDQALRAVLSL